MRRYVSLLIALCLLLSLPACGHRDAGSKTAQWLIEQIPDPGSGSVGGEWLILGLARSDVQPPEGYYERYYENLCERLKSVDGVLDTRKYTEYSRVILALTAIGRDPTNVAGYNLLKPLADFDQTVFQGINGPTFALLALDSGDYSIPDAPAGKQQATREKYLAYILDAECAGGGWCLAGGEAEVDMTAMVLQALAKYRKDPGVQEAVERGIDVLSRLQNADGGYTSYGAESSESISQVIVALAELKIDPEDRRFVKDGKTLQGRLQDYQNSNGAVRHLLNGEADLMASEQALYAMVAAARMRAGAQTLYAMSDVSQRKP